MPDNIYKSLKEEANDLMKQKLLAITSNLLQEEGPHALSMRRIAKEAGCSTTVLYSHFGSKEAIAKGLYLEGFSEVEKSMSALKHKDSDSSIQKLYNILNNYRTFAKANPTHYSIMFSNIIPEFKADEEAMFKAFAALGPLIAHINSAIEAKELKPSDSEHLAVRLWAASHGVVSLELSGMLTEEKAGKIYQRTVEDILGMHKL